MDAWIMWLLLGLFLHWSLGYTAMRIYKIETTSGKTAIEWNNGRERWAIALTIAIGSLVFLFVLIAYPILYFCEWCSRDKDKKIKKSWF